MTDKQTDTLFSQPLTDVPNFVFDASVANVFTNMISRSVPGYETVTAMSGVIANRFSTPQTRLYDLGCSLGATSFAMAQAMASGCRVVAVDNSDAMIARLRDTSQQNGLAVDALCDDVRAVEVSDASVVALNYTLQFVPLADRERLLQSIYRGMNDGAVLILSEKIRFDDEVVNSLMVDLHHDFKRDNGYSDLEISQKREAIDNVLIPETLKEHRQRLADVGFSKVEVWFQCFNFMSLVAFR